MRFVAMHVGARTRYAPEGGMNIDISPTFATIIGAARTLKGAANLVGKYWSQESSAYHGSMSEHLVIVDSSVKVGNANVLSDKVWNSIEKKFSSCA
jgi:hypothetical protein